MGLSFHSTGCVKGAKECWNESHTTQRVGARGKRKTRRVETAGFSQFFRGKSYEIRDCPNDSRTR